MNDDRVKIEQRMQNMKNFYLKIGEIIDKLPDAIPDKVKKTLQEKIIGDKELKELMEGIDCNRPPRIFLIGRTGVGKSSLINALCNSYVARVSDTKSCTDGAYTYQCKDKDRVLMEILDTRGIAESESLDDTISAEDLLIKQINDFSPDVAIFMLNCTHRDDVNSDIEFLKKVEEEYEKTNKLKLPTVVVINKCDQMPPARCVVPSEYPQSKIDKINEVVKNYKEIIVKHGLKIENIIAVSSIIDWQTPDGIEMDAENIPNLPQYDIDNLEIAFDGRYNIEELYNILGKAILDFEAQMGLKMAFRLEEVVRRVTNHLINIFAGISATVALTPIPVADIYILVILQSCLVALIASLSGRDVSLDTAKEFILSMGGVAGVGFALRTLAQQASKAINVIWPGAGSAVSSGIAFAGTTAIGKAAVSYYIDDISLEDVKSQFECEKEKVTE